MDLKTPDMWRKAAVRLVVGLVLAGAIALIVFWPSGQTVLTPEAAQGQREEPAGAQPTPDRKFKVLHIMSYHMPWKWTEDQFNGFKDAMKGLTVEYKVFQMDTKRHSSEAWKQKVGAEARALIDTWKPDLVFTGDDNAQQYVGRHYVNADLPFVFCTVNQDPSIYGFVGSRNVTGVVEHEHFVQTVRLLKEVVPTVRRVAILTDNATLWNPVMERMKAGEDEIGDVKIVAYEVQDTFEQFKERVRHYQDKADALGLVGIFEFKGADGANVGYRDVCRWMVENSNLPDFTFWADRVGYGTLCAVSVSGFAQGQEAGRMARGILVEGRSPSSYPIKATIKGEPYLNLPRARKLNLNPRSNVLLTARIIRKYSWDQ